LIRKYPANFLCQQQQSFQGYHAWYEEGGSNMEVGYSGKRNDNGNILRIIITAWLFYQDRPTVLDDSCTLL